jgi:hypothetical protein
MANREEFWIARLGNDVDRRVIFICGANHRETLRRRFESREIEVKVIEKKFAASGFPNSDFAAYKVAYKDLRRDCFRPIMDGSDTGSFV